MLFIIQIIYVYFVFKEDKLLLLFAYIYGPYEIRRLKTIFALIQKVCAIKIVSLQKLSANIFGISLPGRHGFNTSFSRFGLGLGEKSIR